MRRRHVGHTLAILAATAAVLVRSDARRPAAAVDTGASTLKPWNVLLVTLDTTRADRLGAYGYETAQTPTLDRLAREGVVFERAESVAPLTLPAHYSLMTARLPFEHGVRDNGTSIPSTGVTIAELLRDRGYQTAAFVASFVLDRQWGLDRGFDVYDGPPAAARQPVRADLRRGADAVVDRALEWIQTSPNPFFVWTHFYDAHAPYDGGEAAARGYAGYDGAISFVDAELDRLIAGLADVGLLDRTVVVVVGDHGESLGEHGERTHGLFIYESVTRVPLIIRAPGLAGGRRVREAASSIDVFPTILHLLNVGAPAGLTGRPLLTGSSDPPPLTYSETMYPTHFGWSGLEAVSDGRFKFIAAPTPELYDLDVDPHERRNLYHQRRTLAAALRRALADLQSGAVIGSPAAPIAADDAAARLASLGYASGRPVDPGRAGSLPDPKDKLALYHLITNGGLR